MIDRALKATLAAVAAVMWAGATASAAPALPRLFTGAAFKVRPHGEFRSQA
jgi:hypothetical protein